MSCQCRKGATCADHLAEADLTLPRTRMAVECNCGVEQDDEIHDFGCPLYPEHAPRWPEAK